MAKHNSGLPQGAWVLVADGEKALILVNQGDERDMHLVVRDKTEQENPKAQDWATDRPGRLSDGPSVQRSAVQATDWHALEKERFAKDLAEMLYKDAHKGRFEHLVIAASRPVLSALREALHEEVRNKIVLDVPKVLTNHPVDAIEEAVARELNEA